MHYPRIIGLSLFLLFNTNADVKSKIFKDVSVLGLLSVNELGVAQDAIILGNLTVQGTINNATYVQGPSPSTPNAVPRFANSSGNLLKNSTVLVDDSGNVTLNGITKNGNTANWPSIVGAAGTFLGSDGHGNLVYGTPSGAGNVSSALPFGLSNAILRVDLGSGVDNIQQSIVTLDNSGNISNVNTLTANTVNANLNGNASSATNLLGPLLGDVTGTQAATVSLSSRII